MRRAIPDRLRQGFHELRLAARALRRTPAFSTIAFVLIALGIGATTAIHAVLQSVVLRPLPYPEPETLVSVLHPTVVPGSGDAKWGMSSAGYFEFRRETMTLADLGGYRTSSYAVTGDGLEAEQVTVAQITAPIVTVLRARPALGRWITPDDDAPVPPDATVIRPIVLSHAFWTRRFGADAGVIGRVIDTSAGPREIIGVAEPGLNLPKPGPFASTADLAGFAVDVWEPLRLNPAGRPVNSHQYSGLARLAPGATAADAQRELQGVVDRFTDLFPSAYSTDFITQYHFRVGVTPLREEVLGPTVPRLIWVLVGAVALVFLIACANVANLFLVRVDSRRREAAIRAALGASRLRMAMHFLSESLLLTVTAGVTGVLIANWATPLLVSTAPTNIPLLGATHLDGTSIAFALGLSVVAGVAFALLPLARRSRITEALGGSGRNLTASRPQRVLRAGFVIGQVALAVVLMAGAGALVRSGLALQRVDPGFDPAGVMTFSLNLPYAQYPTTEQAVAFHRQVMDEIRAMPGVEAVGATTSLPLQDYGSGCTVVFREARPFGPGEQTPCVRTERATPGFFEAMSIDVIGHAPTWSDVDTRSQAVVITKSLADRLWPGEDPIGKGINSNGPNAPVGFYRITGVIPALRATALDQPPVEAVFYAATDLTTPGRQGAMHGLVYMIKVSRGSPAAILPQVRAIVSRLNPNVPIIDPRAMDAIVRRSVARTTFVSLLLGLAAAIALVLSAVGIYGVVSYVVVQRRPEIGVRMALGARTWQVVRQVVGGSLGLAAAGVAAGTVLAWFASRALTSLVFEIAPFDPLVVAGTVAVLLVVAVIASAGPARRATRVDPADALRS